MVKVYDLCQREGSAGHLGIGIPHRGVLIPGPGCAQRAEASKLERGTLEFCTIDWATRKKHEIPEGHDG
jgi:hypothetical protein